MQLIIDADDLRPLIREIVAEVVSTLGTTNGGAANGDQLLTENEASQLLRVQAHTLRDARRRGVLEFSRVGRFVRYSRQQLADWLASEKTQHRESVR